MSRHKLLDALKDPNSPLNQKNAAEIKRQILNKLHVHNAGRFDDLEIKVRATGKQDYIRRDEVHVSVWRSGVCIGSVYDSIFLENRDERSHPALRRQIAHFCVIKLANEIKDSAYIGAPIRIDSIFYDYLRQWLTPTQILEQIKKRDKGSMRITARPSPNIVARLRVNTLCYLFTGRFGMGQGVTYDKGTVFITGTMSRTMTMSLVGRDIHSVVEAPLLKDRGVITIASAQKAQLRLVIDRPILELADIEEDARRFQLPKGAKRFAIGPA